MTGAELFQAEVVDQVVDRVRDNVIASVIGDDDVINGIPDACRFLHMSSSTLTHLARAGEIPCRQIGTRWRFSKAQLSAWLGGQEA